MPNMSLQKNAMPSQDPNVRNKNFKEVALGYTKELALDEAQRCLNCKNSPCVKGCPVSIDIPKFIQKVKEEDFEGAYQVIAKSSSLPAVCLSLIHIYAGSEFWNEREQSKIHAVSDPEQTEGCIAEGGIFGMKKELLREAIEQLDDGLIQEAFSGRRKKPVWRRFAALAACLVPSFIVPFLSVSLYFLQSAISR